VCYVKLLPLREFFLHVHPIADLETTGVFIFISIFFSSRLQWESRKKVK
jgi:hypothetical protein